MTSHIKIKPALARYLSTIGSFAAHVIGMALVLLIAFWLIGLASSKVKPLDATDFSEDHRSGMSLHFDWETGCEYLSSPNGGITPRLSAEGEINCAPHRTGKE